MTIIVSLIKNHVEYKNNIVIVDTPFRLGYFSSVNVHWASGLLVSKFGFGPRAFLCFFIVLFGLFYLGFDQFVLNAIFFIWVFFTTTLKAHHRAWQKPPKHLNQPFNSQAKSLHTRRHPITLAITTKPNWHPKLSHGRIIFLIQSHCLHH